jgi:hypothetical protein
MNLEKFEQGYTRASVGANPKRLFQFRKETLVWRATLVTDAVDMFWGTIPSALAAATPHRCGSVAQGTWIGEW